MNITFFVGNGFDLSLGLKTRYSDFYPYFIKNASDKNMIKEWLTEDEKLWADLEEELGNKMIKIITEEQKEKFYIDKEELDTLLVDYLEREQERFEPLDKEELINVIVKSMNSFDMNLSKTEKESIKETFSSYKDETFTYQFVSFNYTNVLDRFLDIAKEKKKPVAVRDDLKFNILGNVTHIHGTTDAEMILGVNDVSQINNNLLKSDSDFLDTFIKERMNENIGQGKNQSVKEIIEKSHIIGIFGMSIGITDKIWWEELVRWLNDNTDNKLIIYYKGDNEREKALKKRIPANTIRLNKKIKNDFMEKGNVPEENKQFIKDRIFVSYNTPIFDFSSVSFSEKLSFSNLIELPLDFKFK